MQFIAPQPFQEAVDKLGSKTLIASGLDSEQWSRVPVALRERAFFSSQVESTRFLQRSRDSIADFLQSAREEITMPDGTKTTALKTGSRADFIKQMQDFAIGEGMGPLDPAHEGTIKDIRTEKRLGLIFDTQTRQAQDYGNWQQGQDPDILNAYPAQRFVRERQVKEPRDIHHHHEGEVQLKTDLAFWTALNQDFGVPWGPWGWGCGHDVEDVDRATAIRLNLLAPDQQIQPVEKDFNDRLEASVQNLDDDMVHALKTAFGDQVHVENGTARWTSQPTPHRAPAPPSHQRSDLTIPPRPQIPPRQSPVSAQIQLQVTGATKTAVQSALDAIDQVHDDGRLNPLPIDSRPPRGCLGAYNGQRIAIKPGGERLELTAVHEIGHYIDDQGLPGQRHASPHHPGLEPWRQAIRRSAAFQKLMGGRTQPKYRGYLLTWKELWARSYAQFIAEKSQNPALLNQLKTIVDGRSSAWPESHWQTDDFAPIAAEIENLFKTLNWI